VGSLNQESSCVHAEECQEVDSKTNEITAIPAFIKQMAVKGVVFAFDAISTQKKQLR
jgi:hypothetical protein